MGKGSICFFVQQHLEHFFSHPSSYSKNKFEHYNSQHNYHKENKRYEIKGMVLYIENKLSSYNTYT